MITATKKTDYSDRDRLTANIIKACYQVHSQLGPGFIERIYVNALKIELAQLELCYSAGKEFTIKYGNQNIGKFRVDFLVDSKVIVEIKALEGRVPKIFESQVISYLKASGLNVGLLINFGNRSCEVRRLMI
jgi:GxxExxY protein